MNQDPSETTQPSESIQQTAPQEQIPEPVIDGTPSWVRTIRKVIIGLVIFFVLLFIWAAYTRSQTPVL